MGVFPLFRGVVIALVIFMFALLVCATFAISSFRLIVIEVS
jgi:hypothetical protein